MPDDIADHSLPPPVPLTGVAPEPVAAAPVPRFCRGCGRPWDPAWVECPACAARAIRVVGVEPDGGPAALSRSAGTDDRPRITSVLALYFSLLAVSVVAMIASFAGAPELKIDITFGIVMSAVVVAYCAFVGRKPLLLQLLKPAAPRWFFVAAFAGLLTFGVATGVIELLHRLTELEKLGYSPVYTSHGFGLGMVVLMVCVQPAVFEELAFRGVILTALQPTLSATEAVVVSAMMFMILHLSPGMFPHTLALGLACGFLRVTTGSLLPCILMHFVHNLMCVVIENTLPGF